MRPASLVRSRMPTRRDMLMTAFSTSPGQEFLSATVFMITTRFAPSPTGKLHLGHAYSAVIGREAGYCFRLRIEDLDQTRARPEFVDGIFEDLRWLGLDWDEPVLVQSQRTAAYEKALDALKARDLVYACFCTRADIAQSLTAPHGDAATSYPGTCRSLPDDPERRATTPHCWRLDSAKALDVAGLPSWREGDQRFDALSGRHRRRHSRPQGRTRFLSSRLRGRRCRERCLPGRARSRSALLHPHPAPAPEPARPARARLPPSPAGRPRETAAVSPSATARRRLPPCARWASTGRRLPPACAEASFPLVSPLSRLKDAACAGPC